MYSKSQYLHEDGQLLRLEDLVKNKIYKRKIRTEDGFVESGVLKVLEIYPQKSTFLVEINFNEDVSKREEYLSNYGITAKYISGVRMYYNSAYLVPE